MAPLRQNSNPLFAASGTNSPLSLKTRPNFTCQLHSSTGTATLNCNPSLKYDLCSFKMSPSMNSNVQLMTSLNEHNQYFRIFNPYENIPQSQFCNVLECYHSSFLRKAFNYFWNAWNFRLNHEYTNVKSKVLRSERFENAIIDSLKDVNDESERKALLRQAGHIYTNLQSEFSNRVLRATGWGVYKIASWFFRSVQIRPSEMAVLERLSQSGLPIVFVSLHRSHLDYLLLTFLLVVYGIRPPHVAGGDNLNLPLVGWWLRRCGAFFIRRRLDENGTKDLIYRAILHQYVCELLKAKESVLFFIEGTRSRSGKPLNPKGGLLSVVVDSYLDQAIPDCILVPVAISYERIPEGDFNLEQLGCPKVPETLGGIAMGSLAALCTSLGNVRVSFGRPVSLHEYVQHKSPPELDDSMMVRSLVSDLGIHLVNEAANSLAVTCTSILAGVLLTMFRDGAPFSQVKRAYIMVEKAVQARDRHSSLHGDDSAEVSTVMWHALNLLVEHVRVVRSNDADPWIEPKVVLPNVFGLAYYGNGLMHTFGYDAIVATAACALYARSGQKSIRAELMIEEEELLAHALRLAELVKYELVLDWSTVKMNLSNSLNRLVECDFLKAHQGRRVIVDEDEEDDEERTFARETLYSLMFAHRLEPLLTGLLRPIVEAYWLALIHLYEMKVEQEVETIADKQFYRVHQDWLHRQVDAGLVRFVESTAFDCQLNALRLYQEWNVVEILSRERLIRLNSGDEMLRQIDRVLVFKY